MLEARQIQQLTQFYIITTPIIIFLGVFVPMMTAEMIRNRDGEKILRSAFTETLMEWKKLLAFVFLMFMILFATAIPAFAGFVGYYASGLVVIAAIGFAVSMFAIIGIGFLIYFLPISVLSEDTFISGVRSSVKTSIDNRNEVTLLMVFSFGLFGLAFASQGLTRNLGFAAFILGRMLSATVTTYTFVVSPNYYLKEKEEEEIKASAESENSGD